MKAKLTPNLREAIISVYKGECQYCCASGANHIDHIVPKATGGEDELGNLILSCASCNSRKGAGNIRPEFIALITAIADKNKPRIIRRLQAKKKRKGKNVFLGIGGMVQAVVFLPKSPTIKDAEDYDRIVNRMIECKKSGVDYGPELTDLEIQAAMQ